MLNSGSDEILVGTARYYAHSLLLAARLGLHPHPGREEFATDGAHPRRSGRGL